jgi:hypothetical protein
MDNFRVADAPGVGPFAHHKRIYQDPVCRSKHVVFPLPLPFSNLARAGGDTEAGTKRKELARIMPSRQVPNPLG